MAPSNMNSPTSTGLAPAANSISITQENSTEDYSPSSRDPQETPEDACSQDDCSDGDCSDGDCSEDDCSDDDCSEDDCSDDDCSEDDCSEILEGEGWDPSTLDIATILQNPIGVDLNTVKDCSSGLLGKITDNLDGFVTHNQRILHVEPVVRDDLMDRFQRRHKQIYAELMRLPVEVLRSHCANHDFAGQVARFEGEIAEASVEYMAEYLSRPMVTFHGVDDDTVVSSIVRYGFAMPGQPIGDSGEALRSRWNKADYGLGIYSTPDPDYAMVFAESHSCYPNFAWRNGDDLPRMYIIVCATLMGLPLIVSEKEVVDTVGLAKPNAHSHISENDADEYVVFDAAQMLPCYVLHIDRGTDYTSRIFAHAESCDDAGDMRKTLDAQIAEKAALRESWFDQYQTARKSNDVIHVEQDPDRILIPEDCLDSDVMRKILDAQLAAKWARLGEQRESSMEQSSSDN